MPQMPFQDMSFPGIDLSVLGGFDPTKMVMPVAPDLAGVPKMGSQPGIMPGGPVIPKMDQEFGPGFARNPNMGSQAQQVPGVTAQGMFGYGGAPRSAQNPQPGSSGNAWGAVRLPQFPGTRTGPPMGGAGGGQAQRSVPVQMPQMMTGGRPQARPQPNMFQQAMSYIQPVSQGIGALKSLFSLF